MTINQDLFAPGAEAAINYAAVLAAQRRIAPYLRRTPVIRNPALDEALGCEAYLKCENLQPIGAFKVRGGINLMLQLPEQQRARGVITASTGNHGQSVAYAARLVGTPALIYVPAGANQLKIDSMRRLGGTVVEQGQDFDECRVLAEERANREGLYFISSGDEPALIAGVATAYLELLEDVPDLDLVLAPVGGGSGASGACLARDGVSPRTTVIGVQAASAPAVHDSWQSRQVITYDRAPTFADGLATRSPFMMPLRIMLDGLADFWVVTEEQMREAIRLLARTSHVVAEGAGAATTAAAMARPAEMAGHKVGLMLSGGNLPNDVLAKILAAG